MGNDVSLQKSVYIDEKATEVTPYWSMYHGEWRRTENITNHLSVFKSESSSEETAEDQFWRRRNPLEKAGKNLMVFRHPNILKYVSTWSKGGGLTLATEHGKPLHLCLKSQNAIQICLGLRSILQALSFLVDKANMRHLNLCMSSIYVTDDGTWKLSGFEFLYAPTELTTELLELSLRHRYQKAIDEKNEIKSGGQNLEQFAFAILCKDIFKLHPQSNETPFLSEFQQYCLSTIENIPPGGRPRLATILEHSYFNQEFIKIHEFLTQLPLKNSFEKQEFFTDLIRKLKTFDERDVAVHLGDLLLSRLVLLDETAQMCVTPFILDPKSDELVPGLFTTPTFSQFVIPKLKQIFTVHDVQIRMILLEHFHKFMSLFPEHELKSSVLPQLLLGIKDTNDHLVAMTLRCLADLVPILGASVVIGKNRNRIFADGRPQRVAADNNPLTRHWPEARSITPVMEAVADDGMDLCQQSFADISAENTMPVRLAPDGGEDIQRIVPAVDGGLLGAAATTATEDDEQWSDWEDNDQSEVGDSPYGDHLQGPPPTVGSHLVSETSSVQVEDLLATRPSTTSLLPLVDNIADFDIQIRPAKDADEMDFFKDMEPVISKTESVLFGAAKDVTSSTSEKDVGSSRLAITAEVGDTAEDGWGDSDWE